MTKDEAMEAFKLLVAKHGLRWSMSVPRSDWDLLDQINKVLTEKDRREAVGLDRPPLQRVV